jgi:hypothetical protein
LATSLDLMAKLLPVAVLLLPLTGGVYRWVSFTAGSPYVPGFVAGEMPITQLATVAVSEVVGGPALFIVILIPGVMYVRTVQRRADPVRLARAYRRGFLFLVGLGLAFLALGLIVAMMARDTGPFYRTLANVINLSIWLASTWIVTRPPYPVGVGRLLVGAATFLVFTGLTYGLGANRAGTYLADITVADGAQFPDGEYVVLGEADSAVWLLPCADPSSAIKVEVDAIGSIQAIRPPPTPAAADVQYVLPDPPGFTPQC